MLRLRHRPHAHTRRGHRNPGVHGVPGEGPRDQDERSHHHQARAHQRDDPQAGSQHVADSGRLREEPERGVLQVQQHHDNPVLPWLGGGRGAGPAGQVEGQEDDADEHLSGHHYRHAPVEPEPECRHEPGAAAAEQLLASPGAGEHAQHLQEARHREDELHHGREHLYQVDSGAEVQEARQSLEDVINRFLI